MGARKVFIGSSEDSRHHFEPFVSKLQTLLGREYAVIPWWERKEWRDWRTTLAQLGEVVRTYDYAVFLLWPDDRAQVKREQVWLPRDNVIFELGLFLSEFGFDRTFLLCPKTPKPAAFRILTDVEGLYSPRFDVQVVDKGFEIDAESLSHELAGLANRIKMHAAADQRPATSKAAKVALDARISRLLSELSPPEGPGAAEEIQLHHLRSQIERLVQLKAVQTSRTVEDTIIDLAIYFKRVDDMLDIRQLAAKQRVDGKAETKHITEVWVFADNPLEFDPPDAEGIGEQLEELRITIAHNLKLGVKYTYVVPIRFSLRNIEKFLKEYKLPADNITVINLEARHFKTFFTVHALSNGRHDVYMSALMKGRDDLLIKVSKMHADRIVATVERLAGVDCTEHGIRKRNFVLEGSV